MARSRCSGSASVSGVPGAERTLSTPSRPRAHPRAPYRCKDWHGRQPSTPVPVAGVANTSDRVPRGVADRGLSPGQTTLRLPCRRLGLPTSWIVNPVLTGAVLLAGYSRVWAAGDHRLSG